MISKRFFDLFFSVTGLLLIWPAFLGIAIIIKLDSPGPVFFRQERVGRFENIFRIHKFRTMTLNAEQIGLQLTSGTDSRITRSGYYLRKYKLDELAQLIDVIKGDMSLVGPRPEVQRYVLKYPDVARKIIFSIRPGITDFASIEFRNENQILTSSQNIELDYIEKILPIKIGYYEKYVKERTLWLDLKLIIKTIFSIK